MSKYLVYAVLLLNSINLSAQSDTGKSTFWHPKPRNYEVKHALEVESLFPMFFTGGYHFAVGYRYKRFRVRFSVINGGTYNAETAGLNGKPAEFNRFYETSPGIFLGYNIWKNLDLYTYVESHTFTIQQRSTGIEKDTHTYDFGLGTSYQIFFGRYIYLQPGFHLYLRADHHVDFGSVRYNIPNVDLSPVIRIGIRYWRKY